MSDDRIWSGKRRCFLLSIVHPTACCRPRRGRDLEERAQTSRKCQCSNARALPLPCQEAPAEPPSHPVKQHRNNQPAVSPSHRVPFSHRPHWALTLPPTHASLFFFFCSTLSSRARLMCGRTPPKAMVARISVSSSSSPRMASCRWRGVMRFTLRSFAALPASSRTSAVRYSSTAVT